jgi:DNA-nicking Smr family endonuclease
VKKPAALLPARGRQLSPEEIALWRHATRAVEPRGLASRPAEPPLPLATLLATATTASVLQQPQAAREPPLAPLERRLRQRLQRGRANVQAVVDLHGMRQGEAHRALHRFLRQAQANGARIVLVITGKGGVVDAFMERGILRRCVPQWLQAPELRSIVLGFEEAGAAHGGTGALYVRIRKRPGAHAS